MTTAKDITLDEVISYMEDTTEESWNLDVVRSKDGSKNCFFGHLFNMGDNERESNEIWDWFESHWSTTYGIYPVNDGANPRYQQPTAKARIIAYLHNLKDGTELTTAQEMELDYQASIAASN